MTSTVHRMHTMPWVISLHLREGDQLTKVTDAVTSATASGSMDFRDGANVATEYTYDANGNMTSDLNKGITNIQYNFLNLPSKVTFSNGGTVTYFYDATGRKLKVVHAKAGKVHTMEYPSQQDMSRMKNIVNDNRNAEVWLYIPQAKNPQCRMLDLVNWKWIDY